MQRIILWRTNNSAKMSLASLKRCLRKKAAEAVCWIDGVIMDFIKNPNSMLHSVFIHRLVAVTIVFSIALQWLPVNCSTGRYFECENPMACAEANSDMPPDIRAKHAVLIEAVTGRLIYEKNADEEAYPASLTKMMTGVLTLEKGALERVVTISPQAAATEDSVMGYSPGDQLSVRDLLMGLMLVSDNSSAVALAEYLGKDTQTFAKMMNAKATEIGLKHTHFVTPNGLPAPDHYSTARDIAYLAAYCWQNSTFRDIVGRETQTVEWDYPTGRRKDIENSNKLLGKFDGANGIKTGWTNQAGGCLAASAKRKGVQLIAVVLDSPNTDTRFTDAAALLEYGFTQVRMEQGIDKARAEKTILIGGGEEYKVTAHPAENVFFPIMKGESVSDYQIKYEAPLSVMAPVKKGDKVGNIIIYYKGQELRQVPILIDSNVNKGLHPLSAIFGILDGIADMIKNRR